MPASSLPCSSHRWLCLAGRLAAVADNAVKYTAVAGPLTMKAHYSFGAGLSKFGLTPVAGQGAGKWPDMPRTIPLMAPA